MESRALLHRPRDPLAQKCSCKGEKSVPPPVPFYPEELGGKGDREGQCFRASARSFVLLGETWGRWSDIAATSLS